MFAMFLYEHKRISLSKACEIGGTSQWDFFEANRQLKIPIHYTQDDFNYNPVRPKLPQLCRSANKGRQKSSWEQKYSRYRLDIGR
jgi:hypothetical protein